MIRMFAAQRMNYSAMRINFHLTLQCESSERQGEKTAEENLKKICFLCDNVVHREEKKGKN